MRDHPVWPLQHMGANSSVPQENLQVRRLTKGHIWALWTETNWDSVWMQQVGEVSNFSDTDLWEGRVRAVLSTWLKGWNGKLVSKGSMNLRQRVWLTQSEQPVAATLPTHICLHFSRKSRHLSSEIGKALCKENWTGVCQPHNPSWNVELVTAVGSPARRKRGT
jgi:hypothetical protein